jgi:hypothetical protein
MKVDKIVLYHDMFLIIHLRSMNIIDKMIIKWKFTKRRMYIHSIIRFW